MEGRKRRIREWPKDDRPRDKLFIKKPADLSSPELLSMLIGSGNAKENSLQLAESVLASCDNRLSEMSRRSVRDLMQVSGIGHAKACALVALGELSRRQQLEKPIKRPVINDSRDAVEFLTPHLKHLHYHNCGIAFLAGSGKLIHFELLFEGGQTSVTIDPRLIFKKALAHRAESIVIGRNYPFATPRPRLADKALVKKIHEAAQYMDIKLMDYIIIGENDYYSFADEGLLL